MRIEVNLRLLAAEEGGRHSGVASGYRCQWRSDRKPEWNDAGVELEKGLSPGAEAQGSLVVAVPHFWIGRVIVGDTFEGAEGSRIVATALVLRIDLDGAPS